MVGETWHLPTVGPRLTDGFIWSYETGMVPLNSLSDPSSAGWNLNAPRAINNLGQIAGIGQFDPPGSQPFGHYVILATPTTVIPEPTGIGLIAAAGLLASRRGRSTRGR